MKGSGPGLARNTKTTSVTPPGPEPAKATSSVGVALPGSRGLYEVRFHGRGGQGTVVASIMLAQAAFLEGRGVQAFPFFGVERRGAPVVAHARIGEKPIRLACDVAAPDAVVVMDASLITGLGSRLVAGLRPGGLLLLNTSRKPSEVPLGGASVRVGTIDATRIARRNGLGSASNPIVNTAVLGALVRLSGLVTMASLESAIQTKTPAKVDANLAAARDGHREALT